MNWARLFTLIVIAGAIIGVVYWLNRPGTSTRLVSLTNIAPGAKVQRIKLDQPGSYRATLTVPAGYIKEIMVGAPDMTGQGKVTATIRNLELKAPTRPDFGKPWIINNLHQCVRQGDQVRVQVDAQAGDQIDLVSGKAVVCEIRMLT